MPATRRMWQINCKFTAKIQVMKRRIVTSTPVPYLVTAHGDAIVGCRQAVDADITDCGDDYLLREAERQMQAYFDGTLREFDLRVAPAGTPFRQAVWRALRTVRYGQVVSYADLASMIGRPEAVRAVANAVAANPIHIIIGCHRVVRSDGSIGGYAGGVGLKRRLLELEFLHRHAVNSK